jgi:glycerophosphoryl diester phosphodiesterase
MRSSSFEPAGAAADAPVDNRWDNRADAAVGGPPWILGHRGAPLEAPENTLSSLRRAMELGLDGVEYDVRACSSGEVCLLHDELLDRTTSARGPLRKRTLPELFGVDAGSWFGKSFAGEPLPLLDEALTLEAATQPARRPRPFHMIELKENGLVPEVARALRGHRALPVRVASFQREAVLDARDAGLPCMLLAEEASEDDRQFAREQRIDAYSVGPKGWRTTAGSAEWSCERWAWAIDEPEELYEAMRAPLFGLNTNEPQRALAIRALAALAPDDSRPYPLRVPDLWVEPAGEGPERSGDWYGSWQPRIELENPFPFAVKVVIELRVRRGAFEVEGLPVGAMLHKGGSLVHVFRLTGGSWRVGGDPVLAATFLWDRGKRGPGGRLTLEAPFHRLRELRLDGSTQRLWMLRERPDDREATMTVRRRSGELLVAIEGPGGLEDAAVVAHLCGRTHFGGRGLRLQLPPDFDGGPGVPFSCGMTGRENGEWRVRRWAGGVPGGLGSGVPGRLRSG